MLLVAVKQAHMELLPVSLLRFAPLPDGVYDSCIVELLPGPVLSEPLESGNRSPATRFLTLSIPACYHHPLK